MNILDPVHPEDFKHYDTALIRRRFLVDDLMQPGLLQFTYTHYDRMMVGSAVPQGAPLTLETYPILRSDYFLERRELGMINVGGEARIEAGEQS